LSKRLHRLVTEEHGKCTHHGDPRLIADECGARERPEKNAACSHFLHEITAGGLPDAMVSHGDRGNVRWSIGMTKALLIMAASIIAMSIMADIRRDNPVLRGFE
jgi:hypothetical protein